MRSELRADDAERQQDDRSVPLPQRRLAEQELGPRRQTRLGQSPPSQLTPVGNERVGDGLDRRHRFAGSTSQDADDESSRANAFVAEPQDGTADHPFTDIAGQLCVHRGRRRACDAPDDVQRLDRPARDRPAGSSRTRRSSESGIWRSLGSSASSDSPCRTVSWSGSCRVAAALTAAATEVESDGPAPPTTTTRSASGWSRRAISRVGAKRDAGARRPVTFAGCAAGSVCGDGAQREHDRNVRQYLAQLVDGESQRAPADRARRRRCRIGDTCRRGNSRAATTARGR